MPTSAPSNWNTVLEVYTNTTGVDLAKHDSTKRILDCVSSEAVLAVIQDELGHCSLYRADIPEWGKLRRKLSAVVTLVLDLHAAISEDTASIMPGDKAVFVAISVLTSATKGVSETYSVLTDLFDRIERSLQRLSPSATLYIFDALETTLAVLAIATDSVKEVPRKRNDWTDAIFGDDDMKKALVQLERVASRGTGLSLAGERAKQIGQNALGSVKKGVENVYDLMRVHRSVYSSRVDSKPPGMADASDNVDADAAPAYGAPAFAFAAGSLLEPPPPVYTKIAPGLDASGQPWTQDDVSAFMSSQCNIYLSVFKLLGVTTRQARALRDYTAQDDAPVSVSFQEGDRLEILGISSTRWIVRRADGTAGVLRGSDFINALEPDILLSPGLVNFEGDADRVIALRGYAAATLPPSSNDISCSLGEIMDVVSKIDDAHWQVRKADGTVGTVSSGVLQVIEKSTISCTAEDAEKAVKLLGDNYAAALDRWGLGGVPCSNEFLQSFMGMLNGQKAEVAIDDLEDVSST